MKQNRNYLMKKFDINRIVENYIKLYDKKTFKKIKKKKRVLLDMSCSLIHGHGHIETYKKSSKIWRFNYFSYN